MIGKSLLTREEDRTFRASAIKNEAAKCLAMSGYEQASELWQT